MKLENSSTWEQHFLCDARREVCLSRPGGQWGFIGVAFVWVISRRQCVVGM